MNTDSTDTGIKDKSGKPIRLGDILQHRLGAYAKSPSNGPSLYRVIRFGKHIHVVPAHKETPKYGGTRLTQRFADYTVIIDHTDITQ